MNTIQEMIAVLQEYEKNGSKNIESCEYELVTFREVIKED